jgi:ribonucleoside-diphosphate reductase alpha chain
MKKFLQSDHKSATQLSHNAIKILERRYLLKDDMQIPKERPQEMFWRVAQAVACGDKLYEANAKTKQTSDDFFQIMSNLEFLPNSPTLMNAGTELGQLSACFVLPVEDSILDIFRSLEYMSLIQQSGGGTGFSFGKLRPKNDVVKTTMGTASGPVSFMKVFDTATEVVKQGGRRRGANMGILPVNHPDILDFIKAKSTAQLLTNFNISVSVTDDFMERVKKDERYPLINPRTQETVRTLSAKEVFERMTYFAWKSGDPGLVFIDEINRHNPTPRAGQIESTNPCGELPLLPYESCNLGSINLSKFVRDGIIDWTHLRKVIRLAVRFLDNVIDVNKYPIPEIEEMTKASRKIGLGIMGFADMLIKLEIPYDSLEAVNIARKLMRFLVKEARDMSKEIAHSRGSFPDFSGSVWEKKGYKQMRNAAITSIAPTGTISIIAGCSSSIEPLFAIAYVRNVLGGMQLPEIHSAFEATAKKRGFYSKSLMEKIAESGSIQGFSEIPEDVKKIFVTAHDIAPEWHVRMQAAFQQYCDNAVSKTVNLLSSATPEDVGRVFMLAYQLKCKGITVYRDGSKEQQVLQYGHGKDRRNVDSESEGCPRSVLRSMGCALGCC